MARQYINPDDLPDPSPYGYSHAIVANGTLHMSGQVGMDGERNLAGETITAQARQAFENVATICDAVDRSLQDIVKVTAHIVDPHERFEAYDDVYQEQFEAPYPCHTVLGVEQLAAPQYLIELEAAVPVDE